MVYRCRAGLGIGSSPRVAYAAHCATPRGGGGAVGRAVCLVRVWVRVGGRVRGRVRVRVRVRVICGPSAA